MLCCTQEVGLRIVILLRCLSGLVRELDNTVLAKRKSAYLNIFVSTSKTPLPLSTQTTCQGDGDKKRPENIKGDGEMERWAWAVLYVYGPRESYISVQAGARQKRNEPRVFAHLRTCLWLSVWNNMYCAWLYVQMSC
jgi:hypothetical protein